MEGKHYLEVTARQPTRDSGQVEVLEFFAYSCSYRNALEPLIDACRVNAAAIPSYR